MIVFLPLVYYTEKLEAFVNTAVSHIIFMFHVSFLAPSPLPRLEPITLNFFSPPILSSQHFGTLYGLKFALDYKQGEEFYRKLLKI
jgi:hypothetical protein